MKAVRTMNVWARWTQSIAGLKDKKRTRLGSRDIANESMQLKSLPEWDHLEGQSVSSYVHSSVSLKEMSDMFSSSIAELLRPYWAFKDKQWLKKTHPQGHKKTNEHCPATYHNWHSPFLWNQIVNAAQHPSVGWQMSGTQIVSLLKQRSCDLCRTATYNCGQLDWL